MSGLAWGAFAMLSCAMCPYRTVGQPAPPTHRVCLCVHPTPPPQVERLDQVTIKLPTVRLRPGPLPKFRRPGRRWLFRGRHQPRNVATKPGCDAFTRMLPIHVRASNVQGAPDCDSNKIGVSMPHGAWRRGIDLTCVVIHRSTDGLGRGAFLLFLLRWRPRAPVGSINESM